MKGLFKSKPRTPVDIVRQTRDLLIYADQSSSSLSDSKREEKMAELAKNIRELKSILYGNSESEPVSEACAQLTQEFFRENTLRLLIFCLSQLNLEARKDATQVVANLQRQQVNSRLIASDYLEKNTDLLDTLIAGYENTDMALHYGVMLRECIRHQTVARYVLESPNVKKFFDYIQLPYFDISADAAATFKVDLVTETDKACEDLIFNYLKQQHPSHKFIGEETTAACGITELTDEPTWIVDPLDGTTNFVHGFPFVCISIGLTIGKVPTVGVVYNPIMEELFTGVHGKGAFLNGKPIKVSSQSELVKSLLATEAGTKRDKSTVDATTNSINSLLFKVRSLRMTGSCALNLCGIACGRIDLFYLTGYGGPWDVAGGAVIVKEAGGIVYDPSGKDFDITSQRVAASNPLLKEAFVEVLQQSE